jgi:hypothetical protein
VSGYDDLEDEAAYQRARQQRRLRQEAGLGRAQQAHDRRTDHLRDHVAGVGRWMRPLGIVVTVLVLVPTIVSAIMFGQYAPIVVAGIVCALAWLAAGLLWRRFARLVAWLRYGSRP